MRFAVALLLVAPLFGSTLAEKDHKTTHKIEMSSIEGGAAGHCSATAIGPHALLTAAHCASTSASISVDGDDYDVVETMGDNLDHMILLLGGKAFTDYAEVDEKPLAMGDEIYVFGNPASFEDIFRRGYVAGFMKPDTDDDSDAKIADFFKFKKHGKDNKAVRVTYYDINGFFGDSGEALFGKNGKVSGIVSFIEGGSKAEFSMKFMGGYEIRLSQFQLDRAKKFVPVHQGD